MSEMVAGLMIGVVLGMFFMLLFDWSHFGDWHQGPFHVEKCYSTNLYNGKPQLGKPYFKVYSDHSNPGHLCIKVVAKGD